jgi:Lar family restriction alleviation protein
MSPFDKDHFPDMDGEPIQDSPEPLPCPFCGSEAENLVVERWSEEDDPDASYHVECLKCGCNGPQAATQLEAAEGWNGRSG